MKRRAFTLIEIMVAIVILVILGSLMLYALKGTGTSAKSQSTRVRLENLKSMLAEYELNTRFAQPASWPSALPVGYGGDFWKTLVTPTPLPPLGNVRSDMRSAWTNTLWTTNPRLIDATVFAIGEMKKMPSNAAAISKLPASEFIAGTPLMADGWGNPIIFVPGTYGLLIDANGNGTADPGEVIITAPNNRPFFASAGPDGDFSKADDNLYSFEQ